MPEQKKSVSTHPGPGRRMFRTQSRLDQLYERFNRRKFVHPDPLEFLYDYPDPLDREIVGLVAASLAYGRVAQILKSVAEVIAPMVPSPRRFLEKASRKSLDVRYREFAHRFARGAHLSALLWGAGKMIRRYGSLYECFLTSHSSSAEDITAALNTFVRRLSRLAGAPMGHLMPLPERGSACKRLHLYLRWMVRSDRVDPGGWDAVSPAQLIVPLDTHMYRIGTMLGFTSRKSADAKTALEITQGFRRICPEDPVRYDFSLTRLGIRPELDLEALQLPVQH